MKKYFSVSEAAREVHTTSETLRYYDRIGLVKPSVKDEWTKYRYYTKQDIIRLNTVKALQQMDLPLQEIKRVLEYDDLGKIVDYLTEVEKKADEKIAALQNSKAKIRLARADYEKKLLKRQESGGISVREFPERMIMLSSLESPTLDNLWNYHRHFYDCIDPSLKEKFAFEDIAGIYTEQGISQMFAVCTRYTEIEGLKLLPAGKYLCADCTEEDREMVLEKLIRTAEEEYGAKPEFVVQMIVVSGILQWNYEVQVLVQGGEK